MTFVHIVVMFVRKVSWNKMQIFCDFLSKNLKYTSLLKFSITGYTAMILHPYGNAGMCVCICLRLSYHLYDILLTSRTRLVPEFTSSCCQVRLYQDIFTVVVQSTDLLMFTVIFHGCSQRCFNVGITILKTQHNQIKTLLSQWGTFWLSNAMRWTCIISCL